jgi:hypothetical protein
MDHLPQVRDPLERLPPVPYCLRTNGYTYAGPFADYGSRFHQPNPQETTGEQCFEFSCLLQNWLFFGLLQEFFAAFGLPFDPDDFLEDHGDNVVVTTRLLSEYVAASFAAIMRTQIPMKMGIVPRTKPQLNSQLSEEMAYHPQRSKLITSLLSTTRQVLRSLAAEPNIDPLVWDSVILLADTLARAKCELLPSFRQHGLENHRHLVDFGEFRFRSFVDLRMSPHWCPSEKLLVPGFLDYSLMAIAFFSQLDLSARSENHSSCSETDCIAYQIDDETYETAHVRECDGLNCEFLGVDHVTASPFATQGDTSNLVQAVTFHNGCVNHVALGPEGISRWVAISHVWADGLGNTKENKLPVCQLARIQQLVNDGYAMSERPVPFWIDTLMIPVRREGLPANVAARAASQKKEALQNMERIYKSADKVIVFDKALMSTNSERMTCTELGARIMCSVWSRRLWTLQEGSSPWRTVFQFSDRKVLWREVEAEEMQALQPNMGSLSTARFYRSQLDPEHPIRRRMNLILDPEGPKSTGIRAKLKRAVKAGVKIGLDSVERDSGPFLPVLIAQWCPELLNPVWKSVKSFLKEITIEWNDENLRGEMMMRCIRGMHYRKCKHEEDQALVLGSMLTSASNTSIKYYAGVDAKERFRILFTSLNEVPIDILFLDQDRYGTESDGTECRWVPNTLLSTDAAQLRPRGPINDGPSLVSERTYFKRFLDTCSHNRDGLVTYLDGLQLLPYGRRVPSSFQFKYERSGKTEYWAVTCKTAGRPEGLGELEMADWVLIPELSFRGAPGECRAVLCRIKKRHEIEQGGICTLVGLASLKSISELEFTSSPAQTIEMQYKAKSSFGWVDENILAIALAGKRRTAVEVARFLKHNTIDVEQWTVG